MKFAHLGDCHLGGWRQPQLARLNFEHFKYAVDTAINEKVDFILIAGDLFDSAYPPIDTIKETFQIFKKINDASIPVFLIAGSHDYSVSGKTFLDVLESAGFAKNVHQQEVKGDDILLHPTIHEGVALYGFPGRKSGLEVNEIAKIKLHDAPGMFRILMLHTTLRDAIGSLPIPAVDHTKLPNVDYLALAHLHTKYEKENRIYCGPTFPNNSGELEELGGGSFYIVNVPGSAKRHEIVLKEVSPITVELTDALEGTSKILEECAKHKHKDKIVLLKVRGVIERGKITDIDFNRIEQALYDQGAYVVLRNTNHLKTPDPTISVELQSDNIEEEIIAKYQEENPHKFNSLIASLTNTLQAEKKEDEVTAIFEDRLLSDVKKVLSL